MDTTEEYILQCEKAVEIQELTPFFWLPKQDEYQEMVTSDWRKAIALISAYAKHFDTSHVTSMEQLWLAFVMREKYNKTWNGTDWIKA